MNAVKKFATFDELKSCESKAVKYALSLKKHIEFEKVVMEIMAAKKRQANPARRKQ